VAVRGVPLTPLSLNVFLPAAGFGLSQSPMAAAAVLCWTQEEEDAGTVKGYVPYVSGPINILLFTHIQP
jgi:hypothetical protein